LLEVGSPCNSALMTTEFLLETLAIALSASTGGWSCSFFATSSVSLLLLVGGGRSFVGSENCSRSNSPPLNSFWDMDIDLGSEFVDMKGEEI
jgi:hypothetical protein